MTTKYKWIMNTKQHGKQTEEGQWSDSPHPHLLVQIPYLVLTYTDKVIDLSDWEYADGTHPETTKWWHPDWVVFKGSTSDDKGWYADNRMSQNVDGPFKYRGDAVAYANGDEA